MGAVSLTWVIGFGAAVFAVSLAVAVRAIALMRRAEQARAALAASQSDLANAQRIGNMGSWQWDVRTNKLAWSDQVYRIFGVEKDFAPTYERYLQLIHFEDRERLVGAINRSISERVAYQIRHRIVRPGGEIRTLNAQGEVVFEGGAPVRMMGICQDVTDFVRLQDEADDQRRKLRGVLDNMFVFVGMFDPDGLMTDANHACIEAWGMKRDEVLGRSLWETPYWSYAPEIRAQARDAIARAAAGEIVRGDYVVRVSGDAFITIDAIFAPLRDRDGHVVQVIGSAVDITARKQAEEAVRASEARLRTILESEPECVKVIDAQCGLREMNAAGLRMVGAASIDELRGLPVTDLVDPKFRAAYAEGVAKVFAGETTLQQFEIVSRDGTRRWMEQHAAPLFDPAAPGTVREMIAVTRDVSERIAMEQASRTVRDRLEQAQRIANIGSWEWDFRTGELLWSDQCYRIVGWVSDGSMPTVEKFLASVHADDRAKLRETIRAGLEDGAPCDYDHRVVWPDGSVHVVHQLGEVERDEAGKPFRMIGTTQDVTALRAIETELRHSRATLTGILTISPEGIVVTDTENRITLFSAGAEAIFGYRPEEVIGRDACMLLPMQQRDQKGTLHPERQSNDRVDVVGSRKGGETFSGQASLSRLDAPGGAVFTTIVRDVTRERAAQAELMEAKLRAETANHAKSQFVANMSHELRTPLNAIIGFSELLMLDGGIFSDARRSEYASDIHSSGKHLLGVINDVLDISRIEAGKVTLDEEVAGIGDLVDSTHRMVRSRAEETGVHVHVHVGDDVPDVTVDRRSMLQILLNLASNAVKFTEREGRVDIAAGMSAEGCVEIAVRDTGIGMSPQDVARVGEPFLQVDGRLARKFEGTGLGLVIAKRLIDMHGGTLRIESVLGAGTTMTVRLPAHRCVPGERRRARAAAALV